MLRVAREVREWFGRGGSWTGWEVYRGSFVEGQPGGLVL